MTALFFIVNVHRNMKQKTDYYVSGIAAALLAGRPWHRQMFGGGNAE